MARTKLVTAALALVLSLGAGSFRTVQAEEDTAASLLAQGQETEKGSSEEACPIYLRLLEKFPKDDLAPRARFRLGLCLKKLGRIEDARARLREARATGKADSAFCHEVELALMEFPPEPEKPKTPDAAPQNPSAPDKGPAQAPPAKPQDKPANPAPPAPPAPPAEPDERAKTQLAIDQAQKEMKDLIKKAQDLEDAGRIDESYSVRAKADAKLKEIDDLKAKLKTMPAPKPKPPAPTRQPPKKDPPPDPEQQRKLMEKRKAELENNAKAADARAVELRGQGKTDLATIAQQEADKARAEAAQIQKRIDALPPPDPNAKKEAELKAALERARAAEKEAQAKGDEAQTKKAKDEVAQREKELDDFQAKTRLDRFADQMKKRGFPGYEIEERLAFAKTEYALQRTHEEKVRALTKELKDKNVPENEQRSKLDALNKTDRTEIDKLKGEVEARILATAKTELEKELQKRAADMRAQGLSAHDIDVKLVEARKELEAKLPDRRDGEKKPAAADDKSAVLQKENKDLKARVEELEKEIAALKAKLHDQANLPVTPTQATSNPQNR